MKYICCGDDADIGVNSVLEAKLLIQLYNQSGLSVNVSKTRISTVDSEYFRMRFDCQKKIIRAYAPRLISSFLYRVPSNPNMTLPNEFRSTLEMMIRRGYDPVQVRRIS